MQYLLVESSGCSAPPVDKKMPRFRPETRPGQTPYFIFLEVTHNLIFLALHVFYSHWNKVCVCSLYLAVIFHPHQNIHQNHSNCPKHFCHCKLSKPNDIKQHGAGVDPHTDRPQTLLVQVNFTAFSSTKVLLPNSLKLPSPPKLHTMPCKPLTQSGMTEVPSTVVASDTV